MTQYLDPTIVRIALMNHQQLKQCRCEHVRLIGAARVRFWRLWCRNRFAYACAIAFYFVLLGGGIGLSGSSLLIASLFAWLITWFFISHTPLNYFSRAIAR